MDHSVVTRGRETGASWGEMLGLWGSGEPVDAAAARGPAGGAGRAAASTYQEGQGLFGALAATGSWIGESLGLIESEQPAAGTASPAGAARGDEAVLGGDSLARRLPSRPADKKDDCQCNSSLLSEQSCALQLRAALSRCRPPQHQDSGASGAA